jgi:hypothetical protein
MNDATYDASMTSSPASRSARLAKSNFGALLRRWRAVRRVSQLSLALDADISTRHLSCLETGRAQPSGDFGALAVHEAPCCSGFQARSCQSTFTPEDMDALLNVSRKAYSRGPSLGVKLVLSDEIEN